MDFPVRPILFPVQPAMTQILFACNLYSSRKIYTSFDYTGTEQWIKQRNSEKIQGILNKGHTMKNICMLLFLAFLLSACGGPVSDLTRDIVENIQDGDATGSDGSGTYQITSVTTNCKGQCPAIGGGIQAVTTCKVGEQDQIMLYVTQTEGHLEVIGSTLYVQNMQGGYYADGSFKVGGYAAQYYGALEFFELVEGSIDSNGNFQGIARLYGKGQVENITVDCEGTYSVNGSKIST